jgi:predicted ATPase
MITLSVEDFSCLKSATFQVAPVTVLIGPQGSGKSVLCKLNYFFYEVLARQYKFAENGSEFAEFKRDIARQFRVWFPPAAWGKKRFIISFSAGPYTARILRRMSKGTVADDVSVTLSNFFESQYNELCGAYEKVSSKDVQDDRVLLRRSLEGSFRIRERHEQVMIKDMGSSYVNFQMFIPAGRAFFTSMGRLVAAMKQGSSLDPVTITFAEMFANLRDRSRHRYLTVHERDEDRDARLTVMQDLFGGELKFERELEYVQTHDGRRIPFTALSSGQQELLPMWTIVDYFSATMRGRTAGKDIFYIEEPEAHLFPAAQSVLMDFLVGALISKQQRRDLVITTHSPYILSKLNNYLKAGALGKSRKLSEQVSKIVPRDCWLTKDVVKAYAIEDGSLKDIIGPLGLISADYIDSISEEVSGVFDKLLDLQYPDAAA